MKRQVLIFELLINYSSNVNGLAFDRGEWVVAERVVVCVDDRKPRATLVFSKLRCKLDARSMQFTNNELQTRPLAYLSLNFAICTRETHDL